MPSFPQAATNQALAAAWLAFALLAVGWFGGTGLTAPPALAALAALLSAATLALGAAHGQTPRIPTPVLACVAALLIWTAFQLLPLSDIPAFGPLLGPLAHPLWTQAAVTSGQSMTGSISLAPAAGLSAWAQTLALLGTFVGAAALARNSAAARLMLPGLALVAVAVSSYGLAVYAGGNDYVLNLPKRYYLDSLTATFINRNTFATFAGVGVLLNLATLLERIGEIPGPQRARPLARWQAFVNLVLMPRWGYLAGAAICFLALILSHSRAGFACTMLGLLSFFLLLGSRKGSRLPLLLLGALALASVFVAFAFLGDATGHRFARVDSDAALRQTIYAFTWQATLSNMWLGTGLDSFPDVFRIFRTPDLPMRWSAEVDHAHNTWLQMALELGLPAMLPVLACAGWLFKKLLQGVKRRRRGLVYPALGFSAALLVGTHALFDFSLEIPGMAYFAALVIALGLAQSAPQREDQPETPASPAPARWLWLAPAALLAASALFSAHEAVLAHRVDPASAVADSLRRAEPVSRRQLREAHAALAAVAGSGSKTANIAAHDLTLIDLVLAQNRHNTPAARASYLLRARKAAQNDIAGAPANSFAWYRLARAAALLAPERPEATAPALAMSMLTGPWEPRLLWGRLPLLAATRDALTPEDQSQVDMMIHQAWNTNARLTWTYARQSGALMGQLVRVLAPDATARQTWQKVTNTPFPTL